MAGTPIGVSFAVALLLFSPTRGTFHFSKDASLASEDFEEEVNEAVSAEEGWFAWGPWMTCSRSCDGGISVSLRKCRGKCPPGDTIRRQICNMQPCPEPNNFRATQCAAYDSVPYRGRRYSWLPFHDPDDPCALVCQAADFGFVAKLAPKVRDGTRCREGALDMCVQGTCQAVGCDLRVGSSLQVDACGVCGGDGSRCRRPAFEWQEAPFGPCAVSCGGGVQTSEAVCRDKESGERVDPRLCDQSLRPRPKVRPCGRQPCPVLWESGDWSTCSASCGTGVQRRPVWCSRGGPNGTSVTMQPEFCPRHQPLSERACVVRECPRWFQGPWSQCSASCGHGVETRAVVCRDTNNQYSDGCDPQDMPQPQRSCSAPMPCPQLETTTDLPPCTPVGSEEEEMSTEAATTATPATTTEVTPTPEVMTTTFLESLVPANWTFSARSFFHAGPWSACGDYGFRRREVHCQILLEFSRTVVRLPDSECPEPRPADVEPCGISCLPPASLPLTRVEKEEIDIYAWNVDSFSPCTSSCGGGTQESVARCMEMKEETEAAPERCADAPLPPVIKRSCNEQACPISASWRPSEFGSCSRSCGGGLRTRHVGCFDDEGREVRPLDCAGVPPGESERCGALDCPPTWKAEPWSKCSRSCAGGFQTRKLHCEKMLVQLPPFKCLRARPKAIKKCNPKPCPPSPKTAVTTTTTTTQPPPPSTSTSHQVAIFSTIGEGYYFEQKQLHRRVTLKAQGKAVLFKGSTAKFNCPLQQPINGSRVLWFKGHRRIPVETGGGWPRVSASPKGALRLRKMVFSDSGTYTCLAGAFRSDIMLKVKPLLSTNEDASKEHLSRKRALAGPKWMRTMFEAS